MKKIIKILSIVIFSFILFTNIAKAAADVNLTIRDGSTIVFSGPVPLQPAEMIDLNDSNGVPHSLDVNSVLSVINDADQLSSDFSISNLIYYDSYGSFYLKCITDSAGNRCDNWQYVVNDTTPGLGMDKNILLGGENIYLYFGQNHKIYLNSNAITTDDALTVHAQNYHYQDDTWLPLTGITVGLTQIDPNNPWTPVEIQTSLVDANGLVSFSAIPAGSYNIGIKEDFYFPTEILNVTNPIPSTAPHGGGGAILSIQQTSLVIKPVFDINKAFDFIISQQKENGSWGADLYTDWVAIALSSISELREQKNKLINYYNGVSINSNLTDYERRVMALMALNIDPYEVNGENPAEDEVNYIEKIIKEFDGKQFGEKEEDNDDIFALIVLSNAGYTKDNETIKSTINFILSKQKENGSWDNSIDMTGAAIQGIMTIAEKNCFLLGSLSGPASPALTLDSSVCESPQNKEFILAIENAKEFLKLNQKDNGGFGNISSTAWAMGGIIALGEKPEDWIKNNNNPIDYLAVNQDIDGGIKNTNLQSKIWETSYVLSSLSGKTWNQIMQKFEKQTIKEIPLPEKEIIKTSSPKSLEKIEKKIQKIAIKNNASPTVIVNETKKNDLVQKQNWWRTLLNKIFGL